MPGASIGVCITPYLELWSPLAHCDTNERLRDAPLASIINHLYVMLVERGEIDIVPPTSTSLPSNSLRDVMLNVSVVHGDVTVHGETWPGGIWVPATPNADGILVNKCLFNGPDDENL